MKTCGLDVHKDTIFCAIYENETKSFSPVKEFLTLTGEIESMGVYLQQEGVESIAMESTGIYWIPVWNILESMGFKLMLVNPYLIKALPGKKSDVKDAQRISEFLAKWLLSSSLVPDPRIRALRSYGRKYKKIIQRQNNCIQEMEKILAMCSIRITSFVSNIKNKSVLKIIERIISGEGNAEKLAELVHGRTLNRHPNKIVESLRGFITEHHRDLLSMSMTEYKMWLIQEEECVSKMKRICNQHYKEDIELLKTIPGVSDLSAMLIFAETGGDMKAFENSGRLTGWAGLRPRNDESAGKYKSKSITKGNKYLRVILVQCAWAAVRRKGSYFKEKYHRLVIRKSYYKSLIAISRKIAVVIWHVLNKHTVYNPELPPVYDPVKLKSRLQYYKRESEKLENLLNQ